MWIINNLITLLLSMYTDVFLNYFSKINSSINIQQSITTVSRTSLIPHKTDTFYAAFFWCIWGASSFGSKISQNSSSWSLRGEAHSIRSLNDKSSKLLEVASGWLWLSDMFCKRKYQFYISKPPIHFEEKIKKLYLILINIICKLKSSDIVDDQIPSDFGPLQYNDCSGNVPQKPTLGNVLHPLSCWYPQLQYFLVKSPF